MKIGLLAYHSAVNFGARLQLLSTYLYLKNHNHCPVIINWVPVGLEHFYNNMASEEQKSCLNDFSRKYWNETQLCRTSKDVATIIEKDGIEAVIIGSDAVAKINFPQIVFPCRRIITYSKPTEDKVFPNPFWGEFSNYLEKPIPIAVISASCESSPYKKIKTDTMVQMRESIEKYNYLSVRDSWTKEMFEFITLGKIQPAITPDPVFAFNRNAYDEIPSKEDIKNKYSLPDKYLLLSFIRKSVSDRWISDFENEAEKNGYTCVSLPISYSNSVYNTKHKINLPLTPIDWYALIAYSDGYIGHNMHPVVIALTNGVPVFSFDNYGKTKCLGLISDGSNSKVYHILKKAGLEDNRVSCVGRRYSVPSSKMVLSKIISFNRERTLEFASDYYEQYIKMMETVLQSFNQ